MTHGFQWISEVLSNVLGLVGWEALRNLLYKFFEHEGQKMIKKAVEDHWVYIQYFLTGRVPGSIRDLYELSLVELEKDPDGPVLTPRIRNRINAIADTTTRDEAIMRYVVPPTEEKDDGARQIAIEETASILKTKAELPDDEWKVEVDTIKPTTAAKRVTFDRFIDFVRNDLKGAIEVCYAGGKVAAKDVYDAVKKIGGDAWKFAEPALEGFKKGAVETGKWTAAKYKETGDNWQATGVNDALGTLNKSLLDRIKKNLS